LKRRNQHEDFKQVKIPRFPFYAVAKKDLKELIRISNECRNSHETGDNFVDFDEIHKKYLNQQGVLQDSPTLNIETNVGQMIRKGTGSPDGLTPFKSQGTFSSKMRI
jgi:hypothetical protein